jgi:hypothetical protein
MIMMPVLRIVVIMELVNVYTLPTIVTIMIPVLSTPVIPKLVNVQMKKEIVMIIMPVLRIVAILKLEIVQTNRLIVMMIMCAQRTVAILSTVSALMRQPNAMITSCVLLTNVIPSMDVLTLPLMSDVLFILSTPVRLPGVMPLPDVDLWIFAHINMRKNSFFLKL